MDLHSHTRYSNCGRDEPSALCDAAVAGGVELFGISDHHYGIAERGFDKYLAEMDDLRTAYKDKLRLLRGVEISSLTRFAPPPDDFTAQTDYALVEHLDVYDDTAAKSDLLAYIDRLCALTRVGIAHTDLFALAPAYGMTPETLFREFASRGVFWEMNVNYDSIHHYRRHEYVERFFESPDEQALVRDTGLCLSAGFDGHRVEDYRPARLRYAARFFEEHGLKTVRF